MTYKALLSPLYNLHLTTAQEGWQGVRGNHSHFAEGEHFPSQKESDLPHLSPFHGRMRKNKGLRTRRPSSGKNTLDL